jgi:hypothetical protein
MNNLIAAIRNEMAGLRHHSLALENYMTAKTGQRDWHAVSDAANDVREINAQLSAYSKVLARLEGLVQLDEGPSTPITHRAGLVTVLPVQAGTEPSGDSGSTGSGGGEEGRAEGAGT